jgi:hypothetical protein
VKTPNKESQNPKIRVILSSHTLLDFSFTASPPSGQMASSDKRVGDSWEESILILKLFLIVR